MGYLRVLFAKLLVSKVDDLVRILDAFEARLKVAAERYRDEALAADLEADQLRRKAVDARAAAGRNQEAAIRLKNLLK